MSLVQVVAGNRVLASDLNQFYNLLKGVAASGESITLIYNAAGAIIIQPSSDPAAGTEAIVIKNNAGTVQGGFTYDGKMYAAAGTAALPGLSFHAETASGIYRGSAASFGFSVNNSLKTQWDATGFSLDGGVTYLNRDLSEQPGRWLFDWNGKQTIESTLSGTGTYAIAPPNNNAAGFATGGTSGGTSGGRIIIGGFANNGTGKCRQFKISGAFNNIDANTNAYIFLTDESATGVPSLTARHVGLKNLAGVVSFTTGDNTTEQATVVTTAFAAATEFNVDITYDGTTARCYVNGVLQATHATNVPAAAATSPIFRCYITNTAAAQKQLFLDEVHTVFAD